MDRAIALLREGERQAAALPIGSADKAKVERAVRDLHSAYASLASVAVSGEVLTRAVEMIDEAEGAIATVRNRL